MRDRAGPRGPTCSSRLERVTSRARAGRSDQSQSRTRGPPPHTRVRLRKTAAHEGPRVVRVLVDSFLLLHAELFELVFDGAGFRSRLFHLGLERSERRPIGRVCRVRVSHGARVEASRHLFEEKIMCRSRRSKSERVAVFRILRRELSPGEKSQCSAVGCLQCQRADAARELRSGRLPLDSLKIVSRRLDSIRPWLDSARAPLIRANIRHLFCIRSSRESFDTRSDRHSRPALRKIGSLRCDSRPI